MGQTTNSHKMHMLPISAQEEAEKNNRGLWAEKRRTWNSQQVLLKIMAGRLKSSDWGGFAQSNSTFVQGAQETTYKNWSCLATAHTGTWPDKDSCKQGLILGTTEKIIKIKQNSEQ